MALNHDELFGERNNGLILITLSRLKTMKFW